MLRPQSDVLKAVIEKAYESISKWDVLGEVDPDDAETFYDYLTGEISSDDLIGAAKGYDPTGELVLAIEAVASYKEGFDFAHSDKAISCLQRLLDSAPALHVAVMMADALHRLARAYSIAQDYEAENEGVAVSVDEATRSVDRLLKDLGLPASREATMQFARCIVKQKVRETALQAPGVC